MDFRDWIAVAGVFVAACAGPEDSRAGCEADGDGSIGCGVGDGESVYREVGEAQLHDRAFTG
jgi:hypothetical protein